MKKKLHDNKKANRRLIITVIAILLTATLSSGGLFVYFYSTDYGVRPDIDAKAQNVILLIGDGMGLNHIKAAELYNDVSFTDLPYQGLVSTRSLSLFPTDSAAAATAMATGRKVSNGRISTTKNGSLINIGDIVKDSDMKMGVITTKNVTDATPAAFTSHNEKRSNEQEIALDQIRNSGLDLLIGMGRQYFDPYAAEIITDDRAYCTSFRELMANGKDKTFAIFEDPIPREGDNTLAALTSAALAKLENDNGFFLMVEGAKIDSYSHQNDIDGMLNEFWGFNDAVRVALSYASVKPNTTVIVVADHETGKLNIPKDATKDDVSDSWYKQGSHSARKIGCFITGPGASELPAEIDNTDIFFIIKQLLFGD